MDKLKEESHGLWASAMFGDKMGLARALTAGVNLEAKDKDGWTAAMLVVSKGRADCLGLLIAAGADVDAKSGGGWTAAMEAALKGDGACLGLLIAAGADLGAKDSYGNTASMLAAVYGRAGCLGLLIAGGADLESKKPEGWSAATLAADYGHHELADLIDGTLRSRKEAAEMEVAVEVAKPGVPTGRRGLRV